MSYLKALKKEANYTLTMNGAKTHASTGEACLDLFAVAGGMRYRSAYDQIRLFDRAYIENPELAMKLLFYIRDIREGMGERQLFRTLYRHVAKTWPASARKNARLVPEYGRFDDLLCLLGTPAKREAVKTIENQLHKDLASLEKRESGEKDAPISLLAKWMPSINTSSYKTRRQAQILSQALNMTPYAYRKTLARLRANTCVTERYLSDARPDKIQYPAVPGGAMLKYRSAFAKKDTERFKGYLADVSNGSAKMHGAQLFPYEIVRPYIVNRGWQTLKHAEGADVLEALWNSLPKEFGNDNAISVIDTSGSMYWTCRPDAVTPALISQSLGLYHAERCKGVFHNHFISFESWPHLIEIHGETLEDKLRYIQSAPWGGSTNLEAVFELILKTAVEADARQDEMPSVLYIISDMEFNCAVRNPNKTVYENARELFEAYGYTLPAVVFINVNSWQMQAPVSAHQKGAALSSGAGVAVFKNKFDGNMTPMSHMLKVLMSDRYKEVHA